jgi:DNA-binding IclR family transcriptional regulator
METIARAQRPMSVTEIARGVSLTRSSVFRLTYTLRHMGFLEQTPDGKAYGLGPRVLNIGFAYLASKDIIDLSRADLEQLRDETAVSSHLAIRDEADILYLSCVQTRSGFLSNMNVGARLPAYATPMGWFLLSDLAPREIARMFDGVQFANLSEHTPRSIEELLQRVASAAANGVVISRGMVEHGGSSVTAPIFDKDGHVVGAIDISGPDSAFDMDALDTRYAGAVLQTAQQISRRLGHSATLRR